MEYLTTKEVAARLRVSEVTLKTWRANGEGPPFAKLSSGRTGAIRYPAAGLDAWLEARLERVA